MSGWSATGFRVYLGSDESEEFRDFFTFIVEYERDDEGRPTGQSISKIVAVTKKKRSIILERAVWRGLTAAGAAAKTPTSGWKITGRNRVGESGQWEVTEELKTEGAWVVA